MPRLSDPKDNLSVDLSSLSTDLPNPTTPTAPFSSTFSSTFSSDFSSTFQSKFSSNFTIDLGRPDYSSINLPSTGVNVPDVLTSTPPSTTRTEPENMNPPTTDDHRPAGPSPLPTTDEGRPRGRATRFRFKSKDKSKDKSKSSKDRSPRSASPDREPRRHRRHHRSSRAYRDDHRHDDFRDERSRDGTGHDGDDDGARRHRRHKRRRREEPAPPPPPPPPPLSPSEPHPFGGEEPALDPETAFRESLFDAMADDEGAAYWEAIYGQPVHIYPQEATNPATGELERMSEAEYAAHVRQKMWERTHPGLVEARARRQREREERAEREREAEARAEEERRIRREVERSLRSGDERRRRREWAARFREYVAAWDAWDGAPGGIPWPTRSGRAAGGDADAGAGADVDEEVRRFFVRGLDLEALGEKEFAARLKDQRVRWHPDKMQQRLGGREMAGERVMRDVTAVFQVIDTLYDDIRSRSKPK